MPAHACELLVDQHPQDFRLCAKRHVCDLVEKDHTAMGLFQQSRLDPALSAFTAKQDFFHPVGGHTGAVDRHKRRRSAGGIGVNIARGDFLAGTRGAASA